MTNDIIINEKIPDLPSQVASHFPKASPEELAVLADIYCGSKDQPNFTEWLESYQQGSLFKVVRQGEKMIERITKRIKELEKEKQDYYLTDDGRKEWDKKMLQTEKTLKSIQDQWLQFNKELRVLVQTNLSREAPRKIEVTQHKVTPSDVANLLDQAMNRKTIDIKKTSVKEK